MRSYVTLLSTSNYLPGVLALDESLKKNQSKFPLLVVLSFDTPVEVELSLNQRSIAFLRLSGLIRIPDSHRVNNGHWGNTFDKIQLFELPGYEKLVYVDSDMLVLQNIDELFDKPHMSATAAGSLLNPAWNRLNSGLMVIEPRKGLAQLILDKLQEAVGQVEALGVQQSIGDQDLINAYYDNWPQSIDLHLSDAYNVFQYHIDEYIRDKGFQLSDIPSRKDDVIKIVHFIGPIKPWMRNARFKHFVMLLKKRGKAKHMNRAFFRYLQVLRSVKI